GRSRRRSRTAATGPSTPSSTFFFQAEGGIRGLIVTGVQTCALPISAAGDLEYLADARPGDEAREPFRVHDQVRQVARGLEIGDRSEERRVGKEWRSRWRRGPYK